MDERYFLCPINGGVFPRAAKLSKHCRRRPNDVMSCKGCPRMQATRWSFQLARGPSQPVHSQEWSISTFLCSLTWNITSYSMENLAFHSLLTWMIIIILPILSVSLNISRLGRRKLEVKGFEQVYRGACFKDGCPLRMLHVKWQGPRQMAKSGLRR